MSESNLWNSTVKTALAGLDPVRIENGLAAGTPDTNYIGGWLELKFIHEWPKKEETPLRIPHFTPEQRTWLQRRCHAGGRADILIQVESDYLLLRGNIGARVLGHSTRDELIKFAWAYWWKRKDVIKDLKKILTGTDYD
jgi:hypothetical protein